MESIICECELYGVDISSISKQLPCSPSEAYQLRIENLLLTKKLEFLNVSVRLKENENKKLKLENTLKTVELERTQKSALQKSIDLQISDNSATAIVSTTHITSSSANENVENITETREMDVAFESFTVLPGALLDTSLSPCSTQVITNSELVEDNVIIPTDSLDEEQSSANSTEKELSRSAPQSKGADTVTMVDSLRNSTVKMKNNPSINSANKTNNKSTIFENCATEFRQTASAYSLRSKSTAKNVPTVRCTQSPQQSDKCDNINIKYEDNSNLKEVNEQLGAHKNQANKHELLADGTLPYVLCQLCKKLVQVFSMDTHVTKFHTQKRPFACQTCDKSFALPGGLSLHKQSHTMKNKCKLCGKVFSTAQSLLFHINLHTGEKAFKCTVCQKRFTRGNDLKRHEKLHNSERPYGCHACSQKFRDRRQLKKHLLTTH